MKILSRNELKQIRGGDNCGARPTCPITTCPGYNSPGDSYYCTNTTPEECQAAADTWCSGNDACCDVNCPDSF